MRKLLGILTTIGLIVVLIWGIKLFNPSSEQSIKIITPTVWDKEQVAFEFSNAPFNILGIPEDSVMEYCQLESDVLTKEKCDTIMVKATMYHAVKGQCDDSPDVTADQTKIPNVDSCSHLNWIAVSQDLLWFNDGPIHYGDTVYIIAGHKTGFYIVKDAMNKR